MPDPALVTLGPIRHNGAAIPILLRPIIENEFRTQLNRVANLFGNPTFAREISIEFQPAGRCFDSNRNILTLEEWCIDWTANQSQWQLSDALSHELIHVLVADETGRTPNDVRVIEEGLATWSQTMPAFNILPTVDRRYRNALVLLRYAANLVPTLFQRWRQGNDAPLFGRRDDRFLEVTCGITDHNLRLELLRNFW